ncbi:hypothetical protein ACFLWA_00725 [Chloroflexota bacterium]
MSSTLPAISYEMARAAFEAGQKLHLAGRIYLVRPVPGSADGSSAGRGVLWVADERTPGDHGLLLYPDGTEEGR